MIKLKNLWKIALTAIAMTSMLVACEPEEKKEDDPNKGGSGDSFSNPFDNEDVYVGGLFNLWPEETGPKDALKMEKNGNVFTYTFTDETGDVAKTNPYGFKFCTENGWMEQFVNSLAGAENISNQIKFGTEYKVMAATKAQLEEKDENDNSKYNDNSTKFYFANSTVAGEKYTITLDLDKGTMKMDGKAGESLKNYTVKDINTVKGSVTGATWPSIDLLADGSFEFIYDSETMTEVRFIYGVKNEEGKDAGKNFKVQGSECKALGTAVAIKDDEGDDAYCKFNLSLFKDKTTYVVTLDKDNSTCTVKAK